MTEQLRLVSYLAANSFGYFQQVAAYLERQLGIPTNLTQGDDPLGDEQVAAGQVDLAFICGLPLVRLHRRRVGDLLALVAPVLQAERYQDQPVYFADLIVRADSDVQEFGQLAGKVFGYNDLGSNSGYHLVKRHLLEQNALTFIAQEIPSGSHQTSIRWVLAGKVDWAAIDSTVLEQELRNQPELQGRLRVLKSLGPFPIPPVALSSRLSWELRQQVQALFLEPDLQLQAAMGRVGIRRYAAVSMADYQGLRVAGE